MSRPRQRQHQPGCECPQTRCGRALAADNAPPRAQVLSRFETLLVMRGARVQVSGAMARVTADGQTLILRLTPVVQGLLSTHRKLQRLRWGRKRPPRPVTGERHPARTRPRQHPTRQLDLVRGTP